MDAAALDAEVEAAVAREARAHGPEAPPPEEEVRLKVENRVYRERVQAAVAGGKDVRHLATAVAAAKA
eukprot:9468407-Pyramimonas_sp.AAC.1